MDPWPPSHLLLPLICSPIDAREHPWPLWQCSHPSAMRCLLTIRLMQVMRGISSFFLLANLQPPSLTTQFSDHCSFDRGSSVMCEGDVNEGENSKGWERGTDAWKQDYNGTLECSHLRYLTCPTSPIMLSLLNQASLLKGTGTTMFNPVSNLVISKLHFYETKPVAKKCPW